MFTKVFWKDALERAVSTAAQVLLVAIGGQSANQVKDGYEVLIGAALLGFGLSILKSMAASNIGNKNSGSLLGDK